MHLGQVNQDLIFQRYSATRLTHFVLAEHSVSLTVGRGVYEQLGVRIESFSSARRYYRDRINDRLCALRLVPAKCFNAIIFISGGTGADYNT